MDQQTTRANSWSADTSANILRRLGKSPIELGISSSGATCPDVLELSSGDILVIGTDVTDAYIAGLPNDAGCGKHERIIMIPRKTLSSVLAEIS